MSIYNVIHGTNPLAGLLLGLLGYTPGRFGRFRDCHLVKEDGDLQIQVFTRCGGGNREDYQEVFDWARKEENYIRDFDDDFDSAYATIEFKFPDTKPGRIFREQLAELPEEQQARLITSLTFHQRFEKAMEQIKTS